MQASVLFLCMILTFSWLEACVASNCTEECNKVCKCIKTHNGCNVACINQKIKKIPSNLPRETSILDLSHNQLRRIPRMAFTKVRDVIILRIDYNLLEDLDPDSFRGLTYLQELSMEHNNLTLKSKIFHAYLFDDLVRLKTLKLRGNNLFGGNYLDDSIPKIPSLESLYIVGFSQKVFGSNYLKLKRLTYLSFSDENKSSLMKVIPSLAFKNLPRLKYLNMSSCRIKRIYPGTFTYLKSLIHLDLSYNRNMTFGRLRNALYGLRNISTLETLNISALHQVFGLGTEFTIEDAINLENTSLKTLQMNSNKLELFQSGALRHFPHTLEYLSIKDNRLTFGWYLFEIYQLPNIRLIDSSFKSGAHHLPVMDLSILSKNNLSSSKYPITLETLLFRECYLKYPIPYFNLRTLSNIKYINGSGNMFCPWEGPIIGLENMTWLDLSNNMCQEVSDGFFSGFSSLRKLYIHDNLLGISKNSRGFETLFQNLTKLESLRLSNNHIINMSEFSLRNQVNMKYLDLSRNLFQSFFVRLGHMRNLRFLDLSNNYIKYLAPKICEDIENISLRQNITVNLMINQLTCSCHHIRFFKWLQKMKNSSVHLMYDECTLSNGSSISLKGNSLEKVVHYLNRSCYSILSLIFTATILTIVLIILLIGVLIYRYRWNLRYFYYMMKEKYSKLTETAENFAFDVFVSYAEEDSMFVSNEMVKELEEQCDLRLNIHHRDFVPGRKIVENILSAIQQSRLCFVLLSRYVYYLYSISVVGYS